MAAITFTMASFEEKDTVIAVRLYQLFETQISKKAFGSAVHAHGHTLEWDGHDGEEGKEEFSTLFSVHLEQLHNILTRKPALFIHRKSGIPLIGSLAFGLVDRGTNMLEIKPITGCNINCTFCSVDEGDDSKKTYDYVVEREYLVQELQKMLAYKQEHMDIWLNTQGEPTLYAELIPLIRDIKQLPFVLKIALITNGTLLSEQWLAQAKEAGLTQLDVSINAIQPAAAVQLAGTKRYNSTRVQDMVKKAISLELDTVIAPVYVKGANEKDIDDIALFAQSIGCKKVYIQNFLRYRLGRNPAKEASWEKFHFFLEQLQQKYPSLDFFAKEHTLRKTKQLPKPFRKGETVTVTIAAQGRYPKELLAVADNRCITIPNGKTPVGKKIRILITRDKDNIFYGEERR